MSLVSGTVIRLSFSIKNIRMLWILWPQIYFNPKNGSILQKVCRLSTKRKNLMKYSENIQLNLFQWRQICSWSLEHCSLKFPYLLISAESTWASHSSSIAEKVLIKIHLRLFSARVFSTIDFT